MINAIEDLLYKIRDFFWKYPDYLVTGEGSFVKTFLSIYKKSRPLSHVLSSFFIILVIITLTIGDVSAFLRINNTEYIEGIITGVDEEGNLLTINRLNPLIPPVVQLERDLNEIIYEPLINVSSDGTIRNVLTNSVEEIEPGKKYLFHLKEEVYWHDGEKFDASDVLQTHRLLLDLNSKASTQSSFSKAAQQMTIKQLDDFTVELEVDGILPNFFEAVGYKILPAHLIEEIDANNIYSTRVTLNNNPVGTGPFEFARARNDSISLSAFDDYHGNKPKLESIKFLSFVDEDSALEAIRAGQIHGLAGSTSRVLEETSDLINLHHVESSTLFNQYWSLYFNLRETGPDSLKDKNIRKAIAYAINKEAVLGAIDNQGEEAYGPIPSSSFAYNEDNTIYEFNRAKSKELLSIAGWEGEVREKGGENLSFVLTYVDNTDRNEIAEQIKQDLSAVGIKIDLNPKNLTELNQDYLLPRQFEILLYGVSTFIDPDRFELFHSESINHPGLNIAGYVSGETTSKVVDGELKKIPAVDRLLEEGRSFADKEERKEKYIEFQQIVTEEVPIVFLYHPKFIYVVNQRVIGVVLTDMTSLEDRFLSITEWEIEV